MTLRTIESQFAQLLKEETKIGESQFNLTLEAPVIGLLHPKIISTRLQFSHNPQQEIEESIVPGWEFDCFSNPSEAKKKYPAIDLEIIGHPWKVFQFLKSSTGQAIVSFPPLGTVVLSRNLPLKDKNLHFSRVELSHWLSYALGNELWGENGKWTRFHGRLNTLLVTKKLLVDSDFPGYYPLNKDIKRIEKHGFKGSDLPHAYVLVLPWTFPLSALEKLEKIIQQEF